MPDQIFLDKLDRLINAGQDMKIALHTGVKSKGVVIRIFAPLLVELLFFPFISMLLMLHGLTTVYLLKVRELKSGKEDSSITGSRESKIFRLLRSIRFFFPKKYREEWLGDLMEIVSMMEAEHQPKWLIYTVVFGHFCIVVYHASLFKLGEFFSPADASKKRI